MRELFVNLDALSWPEALELMGILLVVGLVCIAFLKLSAGVS